MLKNSLATHICVYPFNQDNVHNNFHIPKGLSNTFRILEGKHDLCWTWNHPTIHNMKSPKLEVTYKPEAEDCLNCLFLANYYNERICKVVKDFGSCYKGLWLSFSLHPHSKSLIFELGIFFPIYNVYCCASCQFYLFIFFTTMNTDGSNHRMRQDHQSFHVL